VVRGAYLITGDREEAADVAQEAFARAYERWRTVSRLDRPGAWVQRVATNLAISWRRRQRVRARFRDAGPTPTRAEPDVDTDLMAALRSLSPSQRAAVVLRFFADQSVEETAPWASWRTSGGPGRPRRGRWTTSWSGGGWPARAADGSRPDTLVAPTVPSCWPGGTASTSVRPSPLGDRPDVRSLRALRAPSHVALHLLVLL
jgi:hypothetical protein